MSHIYEKYVHTYGSFMRMKTLAMKKLRRTLTNPMKSRRKRLSLGMFGALERSKIINPRPPIVKRKLEASPSMMYCPFTLCGRKTITFGPFTESVDDHIQPLYIIAV